MYSNGSQVDFLNNDVYLSLKIVLIFANSADPDVMPRSHLGLHFLPMYPFRGRDEVHSSIWI